MYTKKNLYKERFTQGKPYKKKYVNKKNVYKEGHIHERIYTKMNVNKKKRIQKT